MEIEADYQGVIQRIYNDKSNHNSSMVAFAHGDVIGINSAFRGQMELEDSISKIKGDSIIQVFRRGRKINIEIAPFYRQAIKKEIENKNKR